MPAEYKVCVVEDDDSLRLALVGLLRSLGYQAEGYASAEHYLERPDPSACSCLVTDIHLPKMSGIELTRSLRLAGNLLPVIMITARSEATLEEKALASGAACLLIKPFEADALIACLRHALDAKED